MKNYWSKEQWKEVQKNFPKSYEKLDKYFLLGQNADYYGVNYPTVRSLYDFFDDNGLSVTMNIYIVENEGDYEIYNENDGITYGGKVHISVRSDIEKSAFIKAFELLEKSS